MKLLSPYFQLETKLQPFFGVISDLLNLSARGYLFLIFFRSGLTKLRDWDSTLFLFEEEYHVPLLPPELAAYMGTGGELVLSTLLVLGLLSRFSAAGLFIVNAVAAVSLIEISAAALTQHIFWGALTVYLLVYGGQRWSFDKFLGK